MLLTQQLLILTIMNKTVTVNIGGMVFHIEEHAYDKLKKYLEAIRGYFTTSDGRDEIIQDIESRIAEMFTERIGSNRQVVVEADVEFMIDTMGRPEQVAGETDDDSNSTNNTNQTYQSTSRTGHRRLYRDPEDKVVGGVCSGISYYFGSEGNDNVTRLSAPPALPHVLGPPQVFYCILLPLLEPTVEATMNFSIRPDHRGGSRAKLARGAQAFGGF